MHTYRTSTGDTWARRLPPGRGSNRSLAGVMLAVSDKTHAVFSLFSLRSTWTHTKTRARARAHTHTHTHTQVSRDFVALKEDTSASATQLAEAKTQIKALTEERELLRATLTQVCSPVYICACLHPYCIYTYICVCLCARRPHSGGQVGTFHDQARPPRLGSARAAATDVAGSADELAPLLRRVHWVRCARSPRA